MLNFLEALKLWARLHQKLGEIKRKASMKVLKYLFLSKPLIQGKIEQNMKKGVIINE